MNLRGIKYKLWAAMTLGMVVVAAAVLAAALFPSNAAIRRSVYENLHAQHGIIDQTVKNLVNEANYLHAQLITDLSFHDVVLSDAPAAEKSRRFAAIADRLLLNEMYAEIAVVYEDAGTESFTRRRKIDANAATDKAFAKKVVAESRLLSSGGIRTDGEKNYLMIGKKISLPYNSELKAAAVYYLDERTLYDAYKDASGYEGAVSFLATYENDVLSHADPSLVGSRLYGADRQLEINERFHAVADFAGEKTLLVVTPLDAVNARFSLDFKLISMIPAAEVSAPSKALILTVLAAGLVCVLIFTPVYVALAGRITAPVRELTGYIRAFDGTRAGKPYVSHGWEELEDLKDSYDKMVARISALIEKNNADAEQKRKLELDALQAQVNPHFLYNALDTISWIAKLKKQKQIEKMTMALANFYRISLHNGDTFVPIKKEIELIECYAQIENVRREGNFSVSYRVDPSLEALRIPKLIVQPLVENAFKHGIATTPNGKIEVSATREGDFVVLEVKDNGAGMAGGAPQKSGGGFGIKSVRERLALEYGEDACLEFISEPDKGTAARIRIPADKLRE